MILHESVKIQVKYNKVQTQQIQVYRKENEEFCISTPFFANIVSPS